MTIHFNLLPHTVAISLATSIGTYAWLGITALAYLVVATIVAGLAQMGAYIAVGAFASPLRPAMVAAMMARPAIYAVTALFVAPPALALVLAAIVALECLVEDVADKLFTGEFRWESDIHD